MIYLNVDRAGTISLDAKPLPFGTVIACVDSDRDRLMEAVSAISRLAYDGETWIASAVRDAETDDAAIKGLVSYRGRLTRAFGEARPTRP